MMAYAWAAGQAEGLLVSLGDRWKHTLAVAQQARRVGSILPDEEAGVLVAAAYLHDVGYAPTLARTGFHPLDGARYVRGLGHERLAGLVAHHSAARFEAEERGLAEALAEFPDERSMVSAALAFCDMTTGPAGQRVTLDERLAEVAERYGVDHVVPRSLFRAQPELAASITMVEEGLVVAQGELGG